MEGFTIVEISRQLVSQVRLPLEKLRATMVMKRIARIWAVSILLNLPLELPFWDHDDELSFFIQV